MQWGVYGRQSGIHTTFYYENVIKVLVGHEKEFTMKHYGGEPFTPERLLEEISKVSYLGGLYEPSDLNTEKLRISLSLEPLREKSSVERYLKKVLQKKKFLRMNKNY